MENMKACTLCGKEVSDWYMKMPSGQLVCLDCAEKISTQLAALKAFLDVESNWGQLQEDQGDI